MRSGACCCRPTACRWPSCNSGPCVGGIRRKRHVHFAAILATAPYRICVYTHSRRTSLGSFAAHYRTRREPSTGSPRKDCRQGLRSVWQSWVAKRRQSLFLRHVIDSGRICSRGHGMGVVVGSAHFERFSEKGHIMSKTRRWIFLLVGCRGLQQSQCGRAVLSMDAVHERHMVSYEYEKLDMKGEVKYTPAAKKRRCSRCQRNRRG